MDWREYAEGELRETLQYVKDNVLSVNQAVKELLDKLEPLGNWTERMRGK